ncbi:NAD-dependent deacylase [Bacillus shivajii]|uniref:SIR2 family NAD-dependent protein deacylase n=1 Tax=Bacillus shivajii TaxID=1983719 RepID=UPI001CFBC5E3|nr:NAD-dependent deacylase [Bacillus shivajii]UCZ54898.1 NAD-dependent deacylase [Bacillus shivajii]
MEEYLQAVLKEIEKSTFTVVLTGAGMSTESGLPDFRSKTGWWKNVDPTTIATPEAIDNNYDFFWEFYKTRVDLLKQTEPHKGHQILAKWEKENHIQLVATQNVDGLHQLAGSEQITELHGSIRTFSCHNCAWQVDEHSFMLKEQCQNCGGKLRPNVILFNEQLPVHEWEKTVQAIEQASLILVIGSSLRVSPVNQLPAITSGKTVMINKEIDDWHSAFDYHLEGSAKEILEWLDTRLSEHE